MTNHNELLANLVCHEKEKKLVRRNENGSIVRVTDTVAILSLPRRDVQPLTLINTCSRHTYISSLLQRASVVHAVRLHSFGAAPSCKLLPPSAILFVV